MYVLYILYIYTIRILCILCIISCNLLCDFTYHSLSYNLIGSIVACAMSTNSLSSALSSCDTYLIRSVIVGRDTFIKKEKYYILFTLNSFYFRLYIKDIF